MPVAFFHISNHHSGINTNHHETSDELRKYIRGNNKWDWNRSGHGKIAKFCFLLVRTIKTSVGRVENDNKIVGIVAVSARKMTRWNLMPKT